MSRAFATHRLLVGDFAETPADGEVQSRIDRVSPVRDLLDRLVLNDFPALGHLRFDSRAHVLVLGAVGLELASFGRADDANQFFVRTWSVCGPRPAATEACRSWVSSVRPHTTSHSRAHAQLTEAGTSSHGVTPHLGGEGDRPQPRPFTAERPPLWNPTSSSPSSSRSLPSLEPAGISANSHARIRRHLVRSSINSAIPRYPRAGARARRRTFSHNPERRPPSALRLRRYRRDLRRRRHIRPHVVHRRPLHGDGKRIGATAIDRGSLVRSRGDRRQLA